MKNITYKMVQWSTPQELHEESMDWLSQLNFIKDEQQFLDKLIREYTIPLISAEVYSRSLSIVGDLAKEEKALETLIYNVQDHFNKTDLLLLQHVDSRNQVAYKETHYYLKVEVFKYTENYRATKTALFKEIKKIMKKNTIKNIAKEVPNPIPKKQAK